VNEITSQPQRAPKNGGAPEEEDGGTPTNSVRCESDADCPRLLGAPCVQCVGGLCKSNHPCVYDRKPS